MAKLERRLNGDFNQIVKKIENGILNGSTSASLEDFSDFYSGDTETGVNYLFQQGGYAGGLTPLLDREGKPIISSIVNK